MTGSKKWMVITLCGFLTACFHDNAAKSESTASTEGAHGAAAPEVEKGEHRGRLLRDGDFTLELAIFETGVPPEYRAWSYQGGKLLDPSTVTLNIQLTRLGSVDAVTFKAQGDFLRSESTIVEPHSFVVDINAISEGKTHTWRYESFEGRTAIEPDVAEALEIGTEIAGAAVMKETLPVYGKVAANQESQRSIHARFDGVIIAAKAAVGDRITQGEPLFTVESNESLKTYTVTAPIDGVVIERNAHPGEQTQGRTLMRIADTSKVWVDLAVFPQDLARVKPGAEVNLHWGEERQTTAKINRLAYTANANQSVNARVSVDNDKGALLPGMFANGEIVVDTYEVPLAVKRSGLQAFRDFTVVYAQVGNEYEVRMLELGREAGDWVEVLGGLKPGTRYVSDNSYVIKADIEKSGAAHDH